MVDASVLADALLDDGPAGDHARALQLRCTLARRQLSTVNHSTTVPHSPTAQPAFDFVAELLPFRSSPAASRGIAGLELPEGF